MHKKEQSEIRCAAAALILTLCCSAIVSAGQVTWDGEGKTDSWHDAANWSTDQIPGPEDHVQLSTSATIVHSTGSTEVASLTLTSGSAVLRLEGGQLTVTGEMTFTNGRFEFIGGVLNAEPVLDDAALYIAGSAVAPVEFILTDNCNFEGESSPGQTLRVQGNSQTLAATLTVATEAANGGIIRLEDLDAAQTSTISLHSDGMLTNLSTGTILAVPGMGGNRVISGGGTLINEGVIEVAPNTELTMTNGTLHQADGLIAGAGEFRLQNGYFHFTGGELEGLVRVDDTDVEVADTVTAPSTLGLWDQCTLIGNESPNVTLWVQGNAQTSSATLSAGPDAVNAGVIRLQSISTTSSTLSIPNGTVFTNAPTGQVQFLASLGGSSMNITGTFVNTGTIHVESGVSISSSGNGLLEQAGGSIDVLGEWRLSSADFVYSGGSIAGEFVLDESDIWVTETATESATVILDDCTLQQHDSSTVILRARGGGDSSSASLTGADGFVNNGTIILDPEGSSASLSVTSETTVTNGESGLIQSVPGTSSASITVSGSGHFINHGQILAGTNGSLSPNGPNSTIQNFANISVAKGVSWSSSGTGTFEQVEGSIDVLGEWRLSSTNFVFTGGSIAGEFILDEADISVAASAITPSTVFLDDCTLQQHDSSAVVLRAGGGGNSSSASLTAADGFVNNGTIILDPEGSSASLSVSPDTTVTNGESGLIQSVPGSSSASIIVSGSGHFINHGQILAGTNGSLSPNGANSTIQNFANISVATGVSWSSSGSGTFEQVEGSIDVLGEWRLTSTNFVFTGGSIAGEFILDEADISVAASAITPSTVFLDDCTLLEQNSPNVSLVVRGGGNSSTATLTTTDGLVNAGTIRLEPLGAGANLTIPNETLFTNGPTGVIETAPGSGIAKIAGAGLVNQGLLSVDRYSVLTIEGDLVNHGVFAPRNVSQIAGNFTQSAGGSFIASFWSIHGPLTTFVEVDGLASLDGSIEVFVGPKFEPFAGTAFIVLAADEIVGSWTDDDTCDQLTVSSTANEISVIFGGLSSVPGDLTGSGSVGVPDLLVLLANWGSCPVEEGECCPADLNGDDGIGVPDLLMLLANWG